MKRQWPQRMVEDVVENATANYPVTRPEDAGARLFVTEHVDGDQDRVLERVCPHQGNAGAAFVIFGDVNRSLRYVDCPFARGVDALKVLKPVGNLYPRYLYHALRGIELPRVGFARHWKYLRRSTISVPPLLDQRRIADALDRVDRLRAARKRMAGCLEELRRKAFWSVCGDPVKNPKGWPVWSFDEVLEDVSGRVTFVPRSQVNDRGPFPVIGQRHKGIEGYTNDERLVYGDGLPLIFFGDHSRTVRLVREPCGVAAGGVRVLAARKGVSVDYVAALLRTYPLPDLGYARHMRVVKRIEFVMPPKEQQDRIVAVMDRIDRMQSSGPEHLQRIDDCEAAFRREWL